MNKSVSADGEFDKELLLGILKEEKLINEIIALELRKKSETDSVNAAIDVIRGFKVKISSDKALEIEEIYNTAVAEGIIAGNYRVVKGITQYKLRSMIGKWNPPTPNQMKILDVIDDICNRVTNGDLGEVYYYTGREKNNLLGGKYAYKLIICCKTAFFVDLNRQILYHIIKK